jgi:hyperosmotically inducible protein
MDDTRERAPPTASARGKDYDPHVRPRQESPMKTLLIPVAVAVAACGLAACDRSTDNASVGQKVDAAVAQTQKSLEKATEKTREAIHENAPAVEQKLSNAGEKIEAATEKTVDRTREAVHEATAPKDKSAR